MWHWILGLLTVMGLGTLKMALAIPAGLAWGLPPQIVALATSCGGILGMTIIATSGHGLRQRLLRGRSYDLATQKPSLIVCLWRRYGVIGLGLLGPAMVSPPIAAALGAALGITPRRLLPWLSLGVALWSALLTALAVLGWTGAQAWLGG
jgi:hypothetical protein